MNIILENAGKRYNREWIFRHFNYSFTTGRKYAITGFNGSGKSTLLQVIAGAIIHNEGKIIYQSAQAVSAKISEPFKYISLATPYLELIEEMDPVEMLNFHATFKPLIKPVNEMLTVAGLHNAAHKQVRYFSSGMKQRLKLAQAFFSNAPVLLLDEPTTNLDQEGVNLYNNLILNYCDNRLVIISSNTSQEYEFADECIKMEDYK